MYEGPIGGSEKCRCKREASYCVTVTGVTVSGEPCTVERQTITAHISGHSAIEAEAEAKKAQEAEQLRDRRVRIRLRRVGRSPKDDDDGEEGGFRRHWNLEISGR